MFAPLGGSASNRFVTIYRPLDEMVVWRDVYGQNGCALRAMRCAQASSGPRALRRGVGARILRPGSRETGFAQSGWRRGADEQTTGMRSRIHPTYKTKYGVANWASYDRALVRRGDVTLWLSPEAIATWEPARIGTRGGQPKYSNLAIETALTLRLLFHLPLRQTEGFLTSVFGIMGLDLSVPDHTTLSRRGQSCSRAAASAHGQDVYISSWTARDSRSSVKGSKPRRNRRTGQAGLEEAPSRRHRSGDIIAHALTDATVDDALTGIDLIEGTTGAVASP